MPTSRVYTPLVSPSSSHHGTTLLSTTHSPPGKLVGLLKGSAGDGGGGGGVYVGDIRQKSREERIRAITDAALDLKQRIMEQSRKLATSSGGVQGSPQGGGSRLYPEVEEDFPNVRDLPRQSTGSQQSQAYQTNLPNVGVGMVGVGEQLPGVGNLQHHAAQAERLSRETEAACRIQAMYRGHLVRTILRPYHRPDIRKRGDGWEMGDSDSNTVTPVDDDDVTAADVNSTPTIPAGAGGQPGHRHEVRDATPPPSIPLKRSEGGGDANSMINTFIRLEGGNDWPTSHQAPPTSQAPTTSLAQSPPLSASVSRSPQRSEGNSYSQIFASESNSASGGSVIRRGTEAGHLDWEKSPSVRDSLLSDSYTSIEHRSVSSYPSPRSGSDHTPMATPKHSLSPRATSVSAITPPGMPSFAEPFNSSSTSDLIPPLPIQQSRPEPEIAQETVDGLRYSPRSLELKLIGEQNILETVEDSLRNLTHLDALRVQQDLTQRMQLREQTHEQELLSMHNRTAEANLAAADEAKRIHNKVARQMQEQEDKVAQMMSQSESALLGLKTRLEEAELAKVHAHQDIVVSAASVAAREAVREVLKDTGRREEFLGRRNVQSQHASEVPSQHDMSYKSDFENVSTSTAHTTEGVRHASMPSPGIGETSVVSIPESVPESVQSVPESVPESVLESVPESTTPVPSRSADDEEDSNEEMEGDINEVYIGQLRGTAKHV